jgi:hypothetical protein
MIYYEIKPWGYTGKNYVTKSRPDLNPYEIRPITKSNDIFDTKFIDFDMIIFFLS